MNTGFFASLFITVALLYAASGAGSNVDAYNGGALSYAHGSEMYVEHHDAFNHGAYSYSHVQSYGLQN